jgi:SAM-dependent methyltransferase
MQQAFDIYAWGYDAHFTDSLIGRAQRDIVQRYVSSVSNKSNEVLEVNCGTGQDALQLSSQFKKWTCTDVSGEMIRICEGKLGNSCETHESNMLDIEQRVGGSYNLIFSNFGGLNCLNESEVKKFAFVCAQLATRKGELIFVVMGRKCLWERFYFGLKGSPRAGRRACMGRVAANISGAQFPVYYYSPKELGKLFGEKFSVIKLRPVGFFIPPTYLEPFFAKRKILFSVLMVFEKIIGSLGFLSNYADHYLIRLKKK